jgi:hypothetical protein
MQIRHKLRLAFLVASVISGSGQAALAQNEIRIEKASWDCLRQNVARYMSVGHDPVIVLLSKCPQTDYALGDLGEYTKNDFPEIAVETNEEEEVLVLLKSELECISQGRASVTAKDEYVLLDFQSCK